jgi:hypothetical protein
MKAYWRNVLQLHSFLASALDRGQGSASCLSCFTHCKRPPHTHWRVGGHQNKCGYFGKGTIALPLVAPHFIVSKFFYSPTDAQVNCLKTILKFTLKLTLKQLRHVSVQSHHHQEAHYSCLRKLQLLK